MSYPAAVTTTRDHVASPVGRWPTLSNQPSFSSNSYARTQNFIESFSTRLYEFTVAGDQRFVGYQQNSAKLGGARISFVKVDCPEGYHIEMRRHEDLLVLQILLRGAMNIAHGDDAIAVRAGQVIMVDPRQPSRKLWQGSSEQIMISFERARLEEVLQRDAGVTVKQPLSFATCGTVDLRQISTLAHSIQTICQDLNEPDSHFGSGHAGRIAERMLGLLVLRTLPNNYGAALRAEGSSQVAPYYVRRAEEYVRTHADADITIDDLVRASGASARSVFYGFRTYRGTTPMGYVKAVRLDLARAALLRGRDSGTTVTTVALESGYSNLSQFSRDYRMRFQESPSQTMTRGRDSGGWRP